MNRLTAMAMAMVAVATVGCANGAPNMGFQLDSALDNRALVTDRVIVRFDGFAPGELVTVRARMADGAESFAVFAADESGSFDTSRTPLSGSYEGADPDGLFYSMRSRTPSMVTNVALHVTFSAEVNGSEVAQARLERYASPELMPVAGQDLCGGIECPQPAPLVPH